MTIAAAPGKRVRGALYLHATAARVVAPEMRSRIDQAAGMAKGFAWNVARLDPDGIVGLLDYPAFDSDAFPALAMSARVNPDTGDVRITDHRRSTNPLILHRKELLVADDYPGKASWRETTERLAGLGLFRDQNRIGRREAWRAVLEAAGCDDQGRPGQ